MVRIVAILSVVLFMSSVSMARGHGEGAAGPGMWDPKELKELNLTKEQKDKVKAIRESSKGKGKELRQATKEARKNMKALLASDASKEEIAKAFDVVQAKQAESAKFMFTQMLQVREILTPEQRAKMKELKESHREKRHHDEDDGDE